MDMNLRPRHLALTFVMLGGSLVLTVALGAIELADRSHSVRAGLETKVGLIVALTACVLLAGAARELIRQRHDAARFAILEERRQLARDLHDGLAQELAFIVVQTRRELGGGSSAGLEQILASAEQALDDSRRAIAALTRPLDEPLAAVLAEEAEEVAERYGLRLELALEDVSVSAATRMALIRIVREAVGDAGRYRHARTARIELTNGEGLRLFVSDDGVAVQGPDGRLRQWDGLLLIRTRAEELGGAVEIRSTDDAGTAIEVRFP